MALTAQQKLLRELDGDAPEQIAWSLLEWIRLIDSLLNRDGVLSTYTECLAAGRPAAAAAVTEGVPVASANGTQRRIAFKLMHLVAELEGREYGQRNQADRAWILATYGQCLDAVMGRWVRPVKEVEVGPEAELPPANT